MGKELCLVHKVLGLFSALVRGLVGVEEERDAGPSQGTILRYTRGAARTWLYYGELGLS